MGGVRLLWKPKRICGKQKTNCGKPDRFVETRKHFVKTMYVLWKQWVGTCRSVAANAVFAYFCQCQKESTGGNASYIVARTMAWH